MWNNPSYLWRIIHSLRSRCIKIPSSIECLFSSVCNINRIGIYQWKCSQRVSALLCGDPKKRPMLTGVARGRGVIYAAILLVLLFFLVCYLSTDNYSIIEQELPLQPCIPFSQETKFATYLKEENLHQNVTICEVHSPCIYSVHLQNLEPNPWEDYTDLQYTPEENVRNPSISRHLLSQLKSKNKSKSQSSGSSQETDTQEEFVTQDEETTETSFTPDSIASQVDTPKARNFLQKGTSEISRTVSIAIALGITSVNTDPRMDKETMLKVFPTFGELLPSFCSTSSCGYTYHFYFAYDQNDAFFTNATQRGMFVSAFHETIEKFCPVKLLVTLHMIRCEHAAHPAWAQNDAGMAAYLHHRDYIYRINDDTRFLSLYWTEFFIEMLKSYDPPNLGVVGPDHRGGLLTILTYDFTHRTHQDIFGFYYPRMFTDWSADRWISHVYRPGRTHKLANVRLYHSESLGRRYVYHSKTKSLPRQYVIDRQTIHRYIASVNKTKQPSPHNVIAMPLYGSKTNYTYGAIRNAQLWPIFYANWTLRFYIPHPESAAETDIVPDIIVRKLLHLGAQVYYVNISSWEPKLSLEHMSLLVTEDPTVENFIIRHCKHRFDERQSEAVEAWRRSGLGLHCMRDHPDQAHLHVVPGLFGGRREIFNEKLKAPVIDIAKAIATRTDKTLFKYKVKSRTYKLQDVFWEKFQNDLLCHDSTFCGNSKFKGSIPFPTDRAVTEPFIGEKFDQYQNSEESFSRYEKTICSK